MNLDDFLQRVKNGETIGFHETMSVIANHYQYRQTEFCNGLIEPLINPAGHNEGSCKIFAFARLHGLSQRANPSLVWRLLPP